MQPTTSDDFEDETDEAWLRDLDVTLTGAFRCARAALPHLAAAPGRRGAIVNIGSVNGHRTSATTPTAPPRPGWSP